MKPLLAGFLVAALTLPFAPAKAAEANWKTTTFWNITGDYTGWCRAEATFGDDMLLSMGLNKEGWKLMIASKNTATPMEIGKPYTIDVVLTDKGHATLTGVAFDPQGLAVSGLTPEFVMAFAYAPSIVIANFGTFNLKGSAEAIIETHACFKALTASGASAPAPTPTTPDREA